MKSSIYFLALFGSFFASAEEVKPKLNIYVYEQQEEETSTEAVFMTEFSCQDPSMQPHVRMLGIAETLSQSASHQGKDLSTFFKETEQPREIKDHISQLDRAVKVRFILPESQAVDAMETLIGTIQNIPLEIGMIDQTIHEETKSNLANTIEFFDKSYRKVGSETLSKQLFEMMPVASSNEFMKENFSKAENHLIIAYPKGRTAIKKAVDEKIKSLNKNWDTKKHDVPKAKSGLIAKSIIQTPDAIVVDGKIYMDSPSWWQKQSVGNGIGIGFLILSILLIIPTFGISFIVMGIPGILLLCQSYLADPGVVEQMRSQISKYGFHYANTQQCIGLTLTPFERRYLFIKEIFDRHPVYVTRLSDYAAYYAIKSYNYNALEMIQFLYPDEKDKLSTFQRNFYHSLEGIEQQIQDIKAELSKMVLPYQVLRDIAVVMAQNEYENNPAVIQLELCYDQYEDAEKFIRNEFFDGRMTLSEQDEALGDLKDNLEDAIDTLESYIIAAENQLNNRLAGIQAQYDLNVLNCKIAINHDSRMKSLENGEWEIMAYYSNQATQYIMQVMDTRDNSFADILDLRSK